MCSSILDRRCDTPGEAMLVAVGHCRSEKGNYCEADSIGLCGPCQSKAAGLKRVSERIKREKQETVKEIVLSNGRRARIRNDGHYFQLEIGTRYSDKPDKLCVERSMVICYSEIVDIRELLNSLQVEEKSLEEEI